MPRLFIAIELPDEVKKELLGLRREIPGVRWLPREQLHLTLAFLGDVEQGRVEPLCTALGAVEATPFTLRLTRPGVFPRRGEPRVLWYGLDEQPPLGRLAQGVKDAVVACGIVTEERPFSPHITLARVKSPGSAAAAVRSFCAEAPAPDLSPFEVPGFTLFQSALTQQGAIHTPLRNFAAAG